MNASTTRARNVAGLGLSMATALVVGNRAMLLALVFARLGRTYPETGGPYVYSKRAFGDITIEGFELSRGRGGARCMSCPLERDAA